MNWMQSNGMHPEFNYIDINEAAGTKFVPIRDEISTAELITIAIQGEKEAIEAYTAAMEAEEIKTYPDLVVMLGEILVDEREHLKMLEDLRSSVSAPTEMSNFSTRIRAALKNFSTNPFSEDDKVKILEYAQTLATEVFGDKKDDEIVKKVADRAIEESDSLEAALGIVKNSYTK
jgi:rubrerythrin